jgi:predicted dienelactone hydrolase
MIRLLLFVLLSFFISPPLYAAEQVREPYVEIWLPPDFQKSEGPWPLILFSHGFDACAMQSAFLTSYLADQGYIVAAPEHADGRRCKDVRSAGGQRSSGRAPEVPFREAMAWSDKTYADRRDDMLFALKSVLDDPQFKGVIDEDRIGIAGYSLGGYTALGLVGAWPSWTDKRYKAALVLSPYTPPFLLRKTLGDIKLPLMYMGGTRDTPITPMIKMPYGAYAQSNSPKYFLEIEGAGHPSFTESDNRYHDLINRQALAFFDHYLKNKETEINPGKSAKNVATYWEKK